MAIKKNIEIKDLADKKSVVLEKKLTSSDNSLERINSDNIKLAQALDQETLNNIMSDASQDLIPPEDLNTDNLESAERMVSGTARSMGIKVE